MREKKKKYLQATWNTYLCKYTHLSIYLKKVEAKDIGGDVPWCYCFVCITLFKNVITCKVFCTFFFISCCSQYLCWFFWLKCFLCTEYWLLMIWLKISNLKVALYLNMHLMLKYDKEGNWVVFWDYLIEYFLYVFFFLWKFKTWIIFNNSIKLNLPVILMRDYKANWLLCYYIYHTKFVFVCVFCGRATNL